MGYRMAEWTRRRARGEACVRVACLALALLAAPEVRAQAPAAPAPGAIAGRVTDKQTGEALSFCNVVLDSTSRGTITDTRGHYVMRDLPAGVYRIIVSRIGHATVSRSGIVVTAGDTTHVNFEMEAVVLQGEPVVVTATRVEQTAHMAPASVAVVDQADIARRAPTTFDQAIEAVSGLSVFRSTGISVQSMQIRGSSDLAGGGVGNRVLLLIDGRPALTSDTGGAFWSLVPMQLIDRVEIVKGAFSSLYGSTAMGGVINVITRRPGDTPTGRLDFKLGFFEKAPPAIRYTQNTLLQSEVTADYSGPVGRAIPKLRYLVSASRKDSDGFSENTAYTFYDLFGKLIYDFSKTRKLELTLGGGRAKNDYPHAWLSSADPLKVRAAFSDDRQEKNYASVDLHYWRMSDERVRYSTRMYYFRHHQFTYFNNDDPNLTIPDNEPYGLETRILGDKVGTTSQLDVRLGDRNRVVTGADFQMDHVESTPDSVLYGNRQINNYALFLQDDITLASWLTATAGARYDWNHLVGVRTLGQVSPKLGLVWTATPKLAVRALFAQAFRAPTIAELYLERELGGGIDFVPNPKLGAEHIVASVETGVRWSPCDLLSLDTAVFRYDYDDLIYWQDISAEIGASTDVYQVRNLNSALIQGFEISLTSHRGILSTSANYTYLDARDTSPGRSNDYLAYRPRHTANFSADVAWRKWQVHGDARYRSKIDEVFLYPLQAPDAYWVFNANLQFALSRRVSVSAKVNNAFNASYEELARYRMPGRNWLFGVAFGL